MNGLANSIVQGQAQRGCEMDCHGGPVSKVSGPPETTASLARGRPPLQARHQRWLQPPGETLSPPTAVISDSAFEEGLQSNEMEMPMFFLSKGQRQQPPNSAASVGGDARVVSCSSGIGGNIGSGTGDQRYCSLGRINKGGSRRARVVRCSGVIGRDRGSNVDWRYCCPCCVGGEGG